MFIFKTTNNKDGKIYVGVSTHESSPTLGTGKYLKQAINAFGVNSFSRETIEEFSQDVDLSTVMDRLEYWIKKTNADDPDIGYNESINENIPNKKRLTEKIQFLLSEEDFNRLNSLMIRKSMTLKIKNYNLSKYVREIVINHIVEELDSNPKINI